MDTDTDKPMIPYKWKYIASLAVTLLIGVIGAVMARKDGFHLTQEWVLILEVVLVLLGMLGTMILPRVQKPPSDDRRGMD